MSQLPNTPENTTLWLEHFFLKKFPALRDSANVEICIIGAGISGLTCAYLLLQKGFEVTIIDKGRILHGDTSKTSAHLSYALDDRFYNLISVYGKQQAKQAIASHAEAINFIEETVKNEKIDCDFKRVNGYLFSNKKKHNEILKEFDAAKALKINVRLDNLPEAIQSEERECLEFANQAQFHPIKYLSRLAEIIVEKGGKIYELTLATNVDIKKNIITLENGAKITAKYVIQTTNFPVQCSIYYNAKVESNRSYIMAFAISKGVLPQALYWDNEDPYHYLRLLPNDGTYKKLDKNDDILIVGGEDHRVGFNPENDPYMKLEQWVREYVPAAKEVITKWSGQILEPVDYLSYIGVTTGGGKNNYMISGDSGNGLTHGTLGALMLQKLITNKSSKWEKLYNPNRKTLSTSKDLMSNLAKSTVGYAKYLTGGDVTNVKEISSDEGKILRKGISKIAAYRDEHGKLYEFSAVCPHLGAVIAWNPLEKTWDCPAHGSRFAATGGLINGPATCDLKCLRHPKK